MCTLPLWQQPPRVLVENLPDGATPESLFEMFSKCGSVLSVAVLEPGQVLPNRFHGCTPTRVPIPCLLRCATLCLR